MAKYKIVWSADARRDLFNILEFYLVRNGSAAYSVKLNKRIRKAVSLLKSNLYLGTTTHLEYIRMVTIGDYQIVYEAKEPTIVIHMVWDCRRNPDDFDYEKRIA